MNCTDCGKEMTLNDRIYYFGTHLLCQPCFVAQSKKERGAKPGLLERLAAAVRWLR